MSVFEQFDSSKKPRSKIELHVHLDGSVRLTTIWELAKTKGISVGVNSFDQFCEKCIVKKPSTLAKFLEPFGIVTPVIVDDLNAIERVAYEFCEDSAKQGVLYCEARYSPYFLCSKSTGPSKSTVTPEDVVISVNKGLTRGQKDFCIKVRSILCCIRAFPEWSNEILELCIKYKDQGVVGIDVAGDEAASMAKPEIIKAFQQAAEKGIHRTAHAGEAGPPSNITLACNEMKAERIGHGYHVLEDKGIYAECIKKNVHFETCPHSSYLTGSVPLSTSKHPIISFAEDDINFSLSRDDPFLIQKTLDEEYSMLKFLGLTDAHFVRANFNAARSCFLPEEEKKTLVKDLMKVYGMCDSYCK